MDVHNVSNACRIMGYSRRQFYETQRNLQTHAVAGLINRQLGARGPHSN
ncbi:helix-turn-helix domain-containing protein [Pelagibius sp. Alg239-R121]